jgi:hypothetical protein
MRSPLGRRQPRAGTPGPPNESLPRLGSHPTTSTGQIEIDARIEAATGLLCWALAGELLPDEAMAGAVRLLGHVERFRGVQAQESPA